LTKIIKEDPDRHMREEALFWLSQKSQSKEAIKLMEHVALNDPNIEVRDKAVFALAQVREGKGVEALKRIAGKAKDASIRKNAVFWMGQKVKSADVIQFLETVALNDPVTEIRKTALLTLSQAPNGQGAKALVKIGRTAKDADTRKEAVFWLGQRARSTEVIQFLEDVVLKDADSKVRDAGLHALSQAPEGRGVEALKKIAQTSKDAGMREEALFWLSQRPMSENVIQFLEAVALNDPVAKIREAALMALSQAPEGRGIEALKKIARTSKDTDMREDAVFWLAQRTMSEDVVQFLEAIVLKETVTKIREAALLGLSQARDGRGVKALMKIGSSAKDAATRKDAIFWLGQQAKSQEVIEFLEKVVREDSDPKVRKNALTALVHAHKNLGVPALINLAKSHPDQAIRKEAIFWLGQSKDPRATEALVEIVNDMK
jgi:HEAT repeat protein